MKKFKILLVLCLLSYYARSQTPYIDVLTAPSLTAYSNQIENKQNETIGEMNKLQQAQAFVSTQMTYANNIQNRVYAGLREVNGTLRNGLQVTRIYSNLENTVKNMNALKDVVADAPEFAVFATKATQVAINKSTDIYTDVADLLTTGDLNLATSGDRRRLLYNIEQNTRLLNIYLINMRLSIQRAKRKGFWKSINPWQTYVNTDKQMFDQILNNAGRL
jgi:hypothetical protein